MHVQFHGNILVGVTTIGDCQGSLSLSNLGPMKDTRPQDHIQEGGFDYPF